MAERSEAAIMAPASDDNGMKNSIPLRVISGGRRKAHARPNKDLAYHLVMRLAGLSDAVVYPLTSKSYKYVVRILSDDRGKPFLGFETRDGRSVWVNLRFLIDCRCELGPVDVARHNELPCSNLMIAHFVGRDDPLQISGIDDGWILNIGMYLDTYEDMGNRLVSFPDEHGALVSINGESLVLLEYPTEWEATADRKWREEERLARSRSKRTKRAKLAQPKADETPAD